MKNKIKLRLRSHRESAGASLLLALLCAAAFLPALNFDACPFDDGIYVGNPYLLSLHWKNLLHHLTTPVLKLYSPLVMWSLSLDHQLWGTELLKTGIRLHNLLLHTLSAILLYHLCRNLSFTGRNGDKTAPGFWAALTAAAAFAVHPQRVESVIWIAERKDCLVLALGLGAIYAFLKAERKNRISLLSLALFILSFGAKPLMFPLPLILLALLIAEDRGLQWKRQLKMVWPYFVWSALYFFLNFRQLQDFSAAAISGSIGDSRLEIAIANFGNYFFRTLIPWGLTPLYPFYQPGSGWPMMLLFSAIAAAVLFFSFRPNRYQSAFRFGWLPLLISYGIAAAPMVGFRAIGNADFADRYSYFPSVFIWIGFAFLLQYLSGSTPHLKRLPTVILFLLSAILLWDTWSYLPVWKSEKSFLDKVLDSPHPNPTAIPLAAGNAVSEGDWETALGLAELYRRKYGSFAPGGQEGADNFYWAVYGMTLYRTERKTEALEALDRAFASPVWGALLHQSYGLAKAVLLTAAGEHLKRRQEPGHFRKAVDLYGMTANMLMEYEPAAAWSVRGTSLMLAGDLAGAEKAMEKAYRLDPDDARKAHNLRQIRKMQSKNAAQL